MLRIYVFAIVLLLLLACGSPEEPPRDAPPPDAPRPVVDKQAIAAQENEGSMTIHDTSANDHKIKLDLDAIGDDGMVGPPDGRRAVHYEFCLPKNPSFVTAARKVDSTLEMHTDAAGRVGCTDAEVLLVGHTRQPQFRTVLRKLAGFPYVKEIQESHFE